MPRRTLLVVCPATFFLLLLYMVIVPETGKSDGGAESYYLFSYFKGNGEDGLHLAYSRDGLKWDSLNSDKPLITPNVGKDKLMRDPCITFGPDRLFHMVWTTSWTDTVIGYANSPDLVNWSEQLAIPVMGHEPTARNCWAPELFYDSDFEQYLIFWSTTIPGRFDKTAKSSEDNYNHRIYFTITKDFKTFSPTELFYDPGFNVIDATIIKSGSTYIMFFKDERLNPPQKNIRWTSAWRAPGPYDIPSKPITGDYWAEGPTAMMIGDSWYVYFDKYREGEYGAVITKDLKNWDDISSKVSFPEGARHGTVFEVPEKILDGLLEL